VKFFPLFTGTTLGEISKVKFGFDKHLGGAKTIA
jgi:hypothetical protein